MADISRQITTIRKELSFGVSMEIEMKRIRKDIHLLFTGGTAPHIGCMVMSVPRPSLTGDGTISATSSVVNAVGHKDEEICRLLAETVCKAHNCLTVCVGGFHVDHLQPAQIEEIRHVVTEEIIPQLLPAPS